MHSNVKMLILSAFLSIMSLAIPFSMENIVWVDGASFSFLIQVALPHLGIAVSSMIAGCAGALYLNSVKDKTLDELTIMLGIIAVAMLIAGFYVSEPAYVFTYSIVCPPLIGLAVVKTSEYLPLRKRSVAYTLIGLLAIPSVALLCIGITSKDWVMVVDFGTGLRVLFGALIGGVIATVKSS